jgi:hypothetical protein
VTWQYNVGNLARSCRDRVKGISRVIELPNLGLAKTFSVGDTNEMVGVQRMVEKKEQSSQRPDQSVRLWLNGNPVSHDFLCMNRRLGGRGSALIKVDLLTSFVCWPITLVGRSSLCDCPDMADSS